MKNIIRLSLILAFLNWLNEDLIAQTNQIPSNFHQDNQELYLTPSNELSESINKVTKRNGKAAGVLQKKIELGRLQGRHTDYPISLTYRSTGYKNWSYAGSVGEGWNIDNLGSISRIVRGVDDFESSGYLNMQLEDFDNLSEEDLEEVLGKEKDSQADVFFITVNGIAEEFYFKPNGDIIINPNSQLKIIPPESNSSGSWEMFDGNGNHYFFGGDNAVEKGNNIVTAWFITKIITDKKDEIQFDYSDSDEVTIRKNRYYLSASRGVDDSFFLPTDLPFNNNSTTYDKLWLSSITINSANAESKCKFIYSHGRTDTDNNDKILTDISFSKKTFNNNQLILRQIALDHNLLSSGLWLDKMDFMVGEEINRTIEFDYKNFNNLRRKANGKVTDYWGSINSIESPFDYTNPYYPMVVYDQNGGSMTPNGLNTHDYRSNEYSSLGLLDKIRYSNGKIEEFSYGSHQFSSGDFIYVGGARIESITTSDKNSSSIKTIYYEYEQPSLVSRPVSFYQSQVWSNSSNTSGTTEMIGVGNIALNLKNEVLSPLPVLYERVITYEEGFGHEEKTFEIYEGVNSSINTEGENTESIIFDDFEIKRPLALLKSHKLFDEDNNLLNESANFYDHNNTTESIYGFKIASNFMLFPDLALSLSSSTNLDNYLSPNIEVQESISEPVPNINDFEELPPLAERVGFKSYNLSLKGFRLDSIASISYESGQIEKRTAEKIKYNDQGFSQLNIKYVNGEAREKSHFFYPADFSSQTKYQNMIDDNLKRKLIQEETEIYRNGNWITVNGTINDYNLVNFGSSNQSTYLNNKTYQFEKSPNQDSEIPEISAKNYKLTTITDYDSYLQPHQVQNVKTNLYNSFIYKKQGTELVAQISNSKSKNIFYTSFEENGSIIEGAKTGRRVLGSSYNIPQTFSPDDENLLISYWIKTASTDWEFVEKPFDSYSINVPSNAFIDEVRIFPVDAKMNTYNYDERGNLISENDNTNQTSRYAYSIFDQKTAEWDSDGNLLWTMKHNYGRIKPCESESGASLTASLVGGESEIVEVGEKITTQIDASGGCGQIYYNWYGLEENGTEVPLGTTLDGEIEFEVFCTNYLTLKCKVTDDSGQKSVTIRKYYKVLPGIAANDLNNVNVQIQNLSTIQPGQKLNIILGSSEQLKCGLSKVEWFTKPFSGGSFQKVGQGVSPNIFFQESIHLRCVLTDFFNNEREINFLIYSKPEITPIEPIDRPLEQVDTDTHIQH